MNKDASSVNWRDETFFAYLDEPPFCFTDAAGTAQGADVELARGMLQALDVKRITMIETSFAELLPGLADGRWHMTTGLFVTEERAAKVDFSRPIWALPDGLMVRSGNPRRLADYRSLAADATARLGVVRDQVQRLTALAAGIPAERIALFDTQDEAARAILAGAVDAYASVALAHRGYVARHGEARLAVVEWLDSPAFGSFALARSAHGLKRDLDEALTRYLGSSAHRVAMARHGFGAAEVDLVAAA